ncbi:MAG: alpha/beta hydrolase [Aphanocapsa feldmannii 277cV]|uniref:Alpha/beta hydrolase n=2 Tax=Aphanocapsa feldmannii TaxID=192050 RepID=A0A524RLF6_9CHRO|nr:MAG: alpha/beta hydrolase [Aphanocapsa feldmannii 288cV]TGG90897.1 MAG: alpha/beta hydrolase [Aphanocapsa feldmannii 277cV]TGH25765.1 MAG: alpha/beta hydrolase [Aphanocapsa feldmannii 277cI]
MLPTRLTWLVAETWRGQLGGLALTILVGVGACTAGMAGSSAVWAAEVPILWREGPRLRSITLEQVRTFISNGTSSNAALEKAIRRSGWSRDELRAGLSRRYDLSAATAWALLSQPAAETWLTGLTRHYRPAHGDPVSALRAAVVLATADGDISALEIMEQLPSSFVADGPTRICAPDWAMGEQLDSLLSWYVFLPACLQRRARIEALSG